ncbi:MAG: pantoate--beta-alanine ligase [Candidatus Omnitrophota bacterium]|nr:pantoate--beta-alanine ligase [Candidatus Omnitrophota bacterium]
MKVIRSPKEFQHRMRLLRRRGSSIGFVPTMGALHEGHLRLVRRACAENDTVVVSIFVNPTQFGPGEDYKKYPRRMRDDLKKLRREKVDYVFEPTASAMVPKKSSHPVRWETSREFHRLAGVLCGKYRPGHFRGVAAIVAKLFYLAQPHRVYFGAKDYQQTAIVRRLISDLDLDIAFRLVPTVREGDGLAMSSRNAYLSPAERARALSLSRVLFVLRREIRAGRRGIAVLRQDAISTLRRRVDRLQYLEIVDAETLRPVSRRGRKCVALAACYVGQTRLIDNVIIPG